MAREVELSTVQAVREIKNLREQIKAMARELGAGGQQINFISKAMTGAATKVQMLGKQVKRLNIENRSLKKEMGLAGKEITALSRKLERAEKANEKLIKKLERLKAAQSEAAAAKRLSTQMARQEKMAVQAGLKFNRLTTQIKQLKLEQQQEAQMLARLSTSFGAFDKKLRTTALTQEQLIKAQTRWIKVSGDVQNSISGIRTRKSHAELSRMTEIMRDLGSSAVLAIGPLSGLGAKILAFSAIAARSGVLIAVLAGAMTALSISFLKLTAGSIKAGLQLDKIMGTLRAGTGSMAAASREFAFISEQAEELGLNLPQAATQFSKLAAAARGTSLEGEGVREIFEGVAVASTAMRLSTDQTTGALRAIEQMISKGNVQAEELRGQLGERLPGAFQLAARAMGVTTVELNKMLKDGEVLAEDLLPKLAQVLKASFAEEAAVAAGKLAFQMERFRTEVFESLVTVERWLDSMGLSVDVVRNVNDALDDFNTEQLTETFERLQEGMMDANEELERVVSDSKGIKNLLQDTFGDTKGLEKFKRQLTSAFTDAKLASSEFFGFVRENREELESLGFKIPVEFISRPAQDVDKQRRAARGGPFEALPRLADFEKLDIPDELKEFRTELERLGKPETSLALLELDDRMNELVETIKKEVPAAFRQAKIDEVTRGFEELRDELEMTQIAAQAANIGTAIPPDFRDKLSGTISDLDEVNARLAELAVLRAPIQELGMTMSQFVATGASASADAFDKMGNALDNVRTEQANKRMADLRKEAEKLAKEADKAAEKLKKFREEAQESFFQSVGKSGVAERVSKFGAVGNIPIEPSNVLGKARADQRNSLVDQTKELVRQNAVIQQRIAGNDKLADQMEARFELMKKFPDLTTTELQNMQKLLEKNKELNAVLKEQEELEKVRKEFAEDFAESIGAAFEDAVIEGEKLSNVLQALLDDINRIILRVLVTKPLENFLTGALTGTDPTGSKAGPGGTPFFGGLLGGLFGEEGAAKGKSGKASTFNPLEVFGPGPHFEGESPAKSAAKSVEELAEASKTATGASSALTRGVVGLTAEKLTERVTTSSLTGSLFEFQVAVRLATQALQAMASAIGAGAGSGASSGGVAGLTSFGGDFGFGGGIDTLAKIALGGTDFAGITSITGFGGSQNTTRGSGTFGGGNPFEQGFSGNPHFQHGGKATRPSGLTGIPGLRGDEVPAVLHVGEEVLTRNQQAARERPIVVNQTMNVKSEDAPGFRRSARSNLRLLGRSAKSSLRGV